MLLVVAAQQILEWLNWEMFVKLLWVKHLKVILIIMMQSDYHLLLVQEILKNLLLLPVSTQANLQKFAYLATLS